MLQALAQLLASFASALAPMPRPKQRRSAQWPRVRAEHLKREPRCMACGTDKGLEVHHKIPVNVDSSRELDPENMRTLCDRGDGGCHIRWGHWGSWLSYNPDVDADLAWYRGKVANRPKVVRE